MGFPQDNVIVCHDLGSRERAIYFSASVLHQTISLVMQHPPHTISLWYHDLYHDLAGVHDSIPFSTPQRLDQFKISLVGSLTIDSPSLTRT